jgi:hypothetical protein
MSDDAATAEPTGQARSPASRAAEDRPIWLLPALALLAVVGLAVKAPEFVTPMGQDQGLYNAIAQQIVHGAVPYRDAWDPKPPGVFYAHAMVLSVISDPWRACHIGKLPWLSRSDLQPRCGTLIFQVFDYLYTLLLGVVVAVLARSIGLGWPGASLAFGFTVIYASMALIDVEGGTPEKLALLPAVAVIVAGLVFLRTDRRRWLVLAGLMAASAALFKPTDLASSGALTLYLVTQRRGRMLPWLWVPLLSALGATWVIFAAMGAGPHILEATLAYNVARFQFQAGRIPLAAVAALWEIFRDGMALPWVLAVLALPWAWRSARLVVLWAVLDVLALCVGGTKFTRVYFMQLVPSCAVLAAMALTVLWRSGWPNRAWVGRGSLLASVATIGVLSASFQARVTLRAWNDYIGFGWTTTSIERLSSMVGALPRSESIFVWGDEAQVYALTNRPPPVRFFNVVGLAANGDAGASARRAEVLAVLERTPPAVIVVDQRTAEDDPDGRLLLNIKSYPELQRLLDERYRRMDASVLRPYPGGEREQVFVRSPELCAQMPGCRLQ